MATGQLVAYSRNCHNCSGACRASRCLVSPRLGEFAALKAALMPLATENSVSLMALE